MRKAEQGIAVALLVVALGASTAEASIVSHGIGVFYSWLTSPVNCLASLGATVVTALSDTIQCAVHNANPERIIP